MLFSRSRHRGVYEIKAIGAATGPYVVRMHQSYPDICKYHLRSTVVATPGATDSYFIDVGGSADLSLAGSASANSANIGDTVTYTFIVTNAGSTDATAVTLIDTLPQGTSLVSVNGGLYSYNDATGNVTISLQSIAPEASATLTLVVVVAPTATGTLTNIVTVSSFESDTNPNDNTSSTNVTVAGQTLTAVSRKTHGGAGDFDINLPFSGTPGIECRSGGATNDYQLILTFPNSVNVSGTPQAQVTSGPGDVGSGGTSNGGAITVSGNVARVPLTNVANAQILNVTLYDVNGSGNVVIPMSVLVGDVNGNGTVNSSDVSQTKLQAGQAVTASNFRADVTANGSINSSDVSSVKSKSGTALP